MTRADIHGVSNDNDDHDDNKFVFHSLVEQYVRRTLLRNNLTRESIKTGKTYKTLSYTKHTKSDHLNSDAPLVLWSAVPGALTNHPWGPDPLLGL